MKERLVAEGLRSMGLHWKPEVYFRERYWFRIIYMGRAYLTGASTISLSHSLDLKRLYFETTFLNYKLERTLQKDTSIFSGVNVRGCDGKIKRALTVMQRLVRVRLYTKKKLQFWQLLIKRT